MFKLPPMIKIDPRAVNLADILKSHSCINPQIYGVINDVLSAVEKAHTYRRRTAKMKPYTIDITDSGVRLNALSSDGALKAVNAMIDALQEAADKIKLGATVYEVYCDGDDFEIQLNIPTEGYQEINAVTYFFTLWKFQLQCESKREIDCRNITDMAARYNQVPEDNTEYVDIPCPEVYVYEPEYNESFVFTVARTEHYGSAFAGPFSSLSTATEVYPPDGHAWSIYRFRTPTDEHPEDVARWNPDADEWEMKA